MEEEKKFDEIIIRRMMMVMRTRMMMVMRTRMMTMRTRTRVVEEHLRSLHCEFLMRCPSSTMSNFQDMPLRRSLSFIDTLVWVGWWWCGWNGGGVGGMVVVWVGWCG